MASKRKPRKSNPIIFVFCEGETEKRYVDMLRTHFRVPIQIVTKVLNTRISHRLINSHIRSIGNPEIDKVFLFYDGDRQDIADRLSSICGVEVMLSCPCVELWFLLHYAEVCYEISTEKALRLMDHYHPGYRKGNLSEPLRETLLTEWKTASSRAKQLPAKSNPSTTAYLLPEYLEDYRERRKMG